MKTIHIIAIGAAIVVGVGLVAGSITWAVLATRDDTPAPEETTPAPEDTTTEPDETPPEPEEPTPAPPELRELDWWQHCALYQIYPRSFKDSDGDGIGDLKGIISELEHFVDAGVDAVWMSPIFTSPMKDFGYDISNFYDIHDEYGTMEDFEELLAKAHELGLKVLLDFVPNHASTEAEYFKKSVAREPGYEDFFMWADPLWVNPENETDRTPPSNWVSQFGGSAWEWNDERQQFYLHQFAVEQADFNFRNPAVKQEMINIMKFWLDKGADGFRVDALPYLIEADPADHEGVYPDDPLSGLMQFESHQLGYTIPLYTKDLIELYDVVYEWRAFVDEYNQNHDGDTRVLFSEGYANVTMTMLYYGNEEALGAHFPFNFDFITELSAESNARDFVYVILRWLTYMPYNAVPNWQFGNHDNNRMPTRFRFDMVDGLNSLNMMLPGASVTYQGEEIGMRDGYVSWDDTVDVEALNRGDNETYLLYSRDPARTPYHWDNTTSAGFSTNETTWLPVAEDYLELNLRQQKEDERSHYKVYQALTKLRREKTLTHGEYDIRPLSDRTFFLVRSLATFDTLALVFNVAEAADTIDLSRVTHLKLPATVYVSSIHSSRAPGATIASEQLTLEPGEALLLRGPPI